MEEFQIVYVLTNSAMPGLVKIGFTSRSEVSKRMLELYGSGVPVPFTLEFACRVQNATEVERALHIAFGPNRFNPKREFFSIQPEQAIAILKLLHTEDATNEVRSQPSGLDAQDLGAAEQLRKRRPNLNFNEMHIPLGAELRSTIDDSVAVVIGPKRVSFRGEETSLTAATKQVLEVEYSVNPGPHWTYGGRTISEIYDDTYEDPA